MFYQAASKPQLAPFSPRTKCPGLRIGPWEPNGPSTYELWPGTIWVGWKFGCNCSLKRIEPNGLDTD
jgi:hypothetical protein